MIDPMIANSADYADALLVARKAKNALVGIILFMLVFQLGLFFAARYKIQIDGDSQTLDLLKYLVGLTDFLGVVLPLILAFILALIAIVMLQGRLLGVSWVMSAFVGCVVLMVLLFPWQAFLMNQTFSSEQFKIPGVLYTWAEVVLRARMHPERLTLEMMYWARFVGWPVAAIILLVKVQLDSGKGMGAALRETGPGRLTTEPPPANL